MPCAHDRTCPLSPPPESADLLPSSGTGHPALIGRPWNSTGSLPASSYGPNEARRPPHQCQLHASRPDPPPRRARRPRRRRPPRPHPNGRRGPLRGVGLGSRLRGHPPPAVVRRTSDRLTFAVLTAGLADVWRGGPVDLITALPAPPRPGHGCSVSVKPHPPVRHQAEAFVETD